MHQNATIQNIYIEGHVNCFSSCMRAEIKNAIESIREIGNNFSYEKLFQSYSNLIFSLIISFIRSSNMKINMNDIDDIFQEVALKLIKNDYIGRFDNTKSSFVTWLYIICKTSTLDFYRTRTRWVYGELQEETGAETVQAVETGTFNLPVGVLTERQEEVITLYFKSGLKAGEIADRLGITSPTVRSIKHQALERLRDHFTRTMQTGTGPSSAERSKAS